jgi:metal-responsive CopG/Arc/MetJ family transcriptional regulator
MRRAKNPTRKISITIPESTFNSLDKMLSYSQSRSAFIAGAIKDKLDGCQGESVNEASTRTLMIHLQHKNDVDETMKSLLLQILSK